MPGNKDFNGLWKHQWPPEQLAYIEDQLKSFRRFMADRPGAVCSYPDYTPTDIASNAARKLNREQC